MNVVDHSSKFLKADGMPYLRFLSELHKKFTFDWYMEVGCRSGKSFAQVQSKTIAVDPVFSIRRNVVGVKPELHLIQKTSDDFFQTGFLEKHGIKISLAFLDGMHLFEFLLRDFIATERNSNPDSIILLHDCCPWTQGMTTRDIDNLPDGPWTGDVWKLVPILQKYRPDLKIDVFDCRPTGLVAVSNLDPKNATLAENYETIEREFIACDIETYGPDKFYDSFAYVNANDHYEEGFALFNKIGETDVVIGNQKRTP
ncbi:MAG: class I SAM-dependent methyltransferase [Pseudomonadota bacterium]